MTVRALQWAQFLAKDNIFWLYEITNTGTTNYTRAIFGMLVGTYVGVTSTEDYGEYDNDWSFFDVNNNLTYSGDINGIQGKCMKNPLWQPTPCSGTGSVGYAFLESPGNPYDGIDNDGDADSSVIGRLAPKFTASSFDSTLLTSGKQIVHLSVTITVDISILFHLSKSWVIQSRLQRADLLDGSNQESRG